MTGVFARGRKVVERACILSLSIWNIRSVNYSKVRQEKSFSFIGRSKRKKDSCEKVR